MRSILLIVALCLALSQCLPAAIVQATDGGSVTNTGGLSVTFTTSSVGFASNTVAGDTLVYFGVLQLAYTGSAPSCALVPSTTGFSWTAAESTIENDGSGHAVGQTLYYITNASAMSTSVTTKGSATCTGQTTITAGAAEFVLFELNNIAAVTDYAASYNFTGTSTVPCNIITLGISSPGGTALVALSAVPSQSSVGAGNGYTLGPTMNTAVLGETQYQINISPGGIGETFGGTLNKWLCTGIAFKQNTVPPSGSVKRHKGWVG